MLDTAVMIGAVSDRYAPLAKADALTRYFAQARGFQGSLLAENWIWPPWT
jgi:DNA repair photolyase